METYSIGDLVKLKGFLKTDPSEIPHAIIVADLGLGKLSVQWTNPKLAIRFAMTNVVEAIEIVNKAGRQNKQKC